MTEHLTTKTLLTALVLALGLAGCYYDNEEELYGDTCDTSDVTYSATVEPIINSTCATTGCHVAGGSGNGLLESYENVKVKVDDGSFRQRVIEQRDMPPGTPLTECQISILEDWLAQGAPNN